MPANQTFIKQCKLWDTNNKYIKFDLLFREVFFIIILTKNRHTTIHLLSISVVGSIYKWKKFLKAFSFLKTFHK